MFTRDGLTELMLIMGLIGIIIFLIWPILTIAYNYWFG